MPYVNYSSIKLGENLKTSIHFISHLEGEPQTWRRNSRAKSLLVRWPRHVSEGPWRGLTTGSVDPEKEEYAGPLVQKLRISRWWQQLIRQVGGPCVCTGHMPIEDSPASRAFGRMGHHADCGEYLFFFLRVPKHFSHSHPSPFLPAFLAPTYLAGKDCL